MRDVDCGGTATDVHSAVGEVSEVQVHSVHFSTCPSWSVNPHRGAAGNFDTLLTDDGPSVVLEQMGPSVASA